MIRRLMHLGVAIAVAATVLVTIEPARSAPSPRGAECNISGSATISPGLGTKAVNQSIKLSTISLTGCRIGNAGSPGVPTTTSGSAVISPNPSTSKGSCATGGLTNLNAVITWASGLKTWAIFSTKSLTSETAITGNVTSSTEPALKPGDIVAGDVAFQPTTTKQNCAKVPVTAVTFTGALGAGSPK
jgi:hypothetical protein